MGKVLGVDVGTSNTRMFVKGKGLRVREPSVVCVEGMDRRVKAAGNLAKQMLGKTPGQLTTVRPIRGGAITDFEMCAKMLEHFVRRECGATILSRPQIIIAVPSGATSVDRRNFEDVALESGAKNVGVVSISVAAAIGAGVSIAEPMGKMIVDIGGGTTEATVLSLGGVVVSGSIKVGGDNFDQAIVQYLKNRHAIVISDTAAENLKRTVGSLYPEGDGAPVEVRGRRLGGGAPIVLAVTPAEIREALLPQASQIIDCIRSTLERTPPELCADIYDNGIVFTGGTAAIRGLARFVQSRTGLKATVAQNPHEAVINGIGKIIEQGDQYGAVSISLR